MNSRAKVIVLIIVILISLSVAGGTLYLFQKEHTRNIELETQLNDLTAKQKSAEAKLAEAQRSISTLESKIKDNTSQIETLTSQLDQEKIAKEDALVKMEQMRSELEQQKQLRSDLEKKLTKAEGDVRGIQAKLGAIESEKAKLEAKVKELEVKSNVELGKIVVNPETVQQAAKPQGDKSQNAGRPAAATPLVKKEEAKAQALEGKVLVLNKEYNFLVLNLGNKDGVAAGDQFAVYRGDQYIGDVKVEKVQDAMAAAGFTSDDVKNKVKEGDKVVRKN